MTSIETSILADDAGVVLPERPGRVSGNSFSDLLVSSLVGTIVSRGPVVSNLYTCGALLSCRVEGFSLSAAAEARQEALHGRFVLQTCIFTGAASLGLGRQRDKLIRNLLNRDSWGWRGGSGGGRRQRLGRGRF